MTAASEASGYDSLADIYHGQLELLREARIPGTAEHHLGETETRMTKNAADGRSC